MARLTLRKALRIKKQIEATLRSSAPNATVSIDIDDAKASQDVENHLLSAAALVKRDLAAHIRLSAILSSMRLSVETANVVSGVSALLSEIAHLDRAISAYKLLSGVEPFRADLVQAKIGRKRAAATAPAQPVGYGRSAEDATSISVSAFDGISLEHLKQELAGLRKRREDLEEQRLGLNASETNAVEIGDDDIAFLREHEIV